MSELSHPTSINRDYIRLLQVMRRFVKEEFAISVSISQEDAVDQLLHYADQSRNNVLQEMAKELQEFTHGGNDESAAAGSGSDGEQPHKGKVRYYRGAAIAVEEENEPAEASPAATKEKVPAPKKIYRGRVIE